MKYEMWGQKRRVNNNNIRAVKLSMLTILSTFIGLEAFRSAACKKRKRKVRKKRGKLDKRVRKDKAKKNHPRAQIFKW